MKSILNGKNIVFVVRDLERAGGLPFGTTNYYIISNFSLFAKSLVKGRNNVLLIKSKRILDTWELLARPEAKGFVERLKQPNVLVFKSTDKIAKICRENTWPLLNPPVELAGRVEEKISQVEWLGPLAKKFLPSFEIKECGKIIWLGKPFILQFNLAHTGSGTVLVESKKQLMEIQKKFPARPTRVTKYIQGPVFTNNNVIWDKKVLVGNINYQITGLKPFTHNTFATIGNDWELAHKILSSAQRKQYEKIACAVGERLARSGWKGLFGIDVIVDEKTGKLYLIEINARQPASTAYESQLQSFCYSGRVLAKSGQQEVPTFQAHLLALLGAKYSGQKLIKIEIGAQLVQRVVAGRARALSKSELKDISSHGFNVVIYENTKPESDKLRFQTLNGLMSGHKTFNQLGEYLIKKLNRIKQNVRT